MDNTSEQIKCIMDAIEHGFSVAETLEECPNCAPDLRVSESHNHSLRHEDMGWTTPTTFSEGV